MKGAGCGYQWAMRLAPVVLVVLSGTAQAETCEVTFVVAPEDARLTIERVVAAEPRCTGQLEVRVVPTEGGLFVLGQRPDGRIHERLVPNAETAGILIASWVGDAWTPAPQEDVFANRHASETPTPTVTRSVVVEPRERRDRWGSASLLVGTDEQLGYRGEVDVFGVRDVRIGVAAMVAAHHTETQEIDVSGSMFIDDYRAGAYGAWALRQGAWLVRPSVGVGVVHSRVVVDATQAGVWAPVRGSDRSTSVDFQGQILFGRELHDGWSVAAGVLATVHHQAFSPDAMPLLVQRSGVDLHGLVAFSHGL